MKQADSTQNFKEFLKEKRAFYKTLSVSDVYCPVLDANIVFNSKGFYHLRYDSHGKERVIKEQRYKLTLLPLVKAVIKCATSIHEYRKEEYSKPLGKYFEIWEIKATVGKSNTTVSVILRRIGTGNITFLSVFKEKEKKTKKPSK